MDYVPHLLVDAGQSPLVIKVLMSLAPEATTERCGRLTITTR